VDIALSGRRRGFLATIESAIWPGAAQPFRAALYSVAAMAYSRNTNEALLEMPVHFASESD
jgi:hypothetical protein